MSCCGQKTSGNTRAIQALMDKALELEEAGREAESTLILESLADYFETVQQRKKKKK